MSEFVNEPNLIELRAAHVENAHRPAGVLHEIAQTAVTDQSELGPSDVADIILPPKQPGDGYEARWELLEGSTAMIKEAASVHQDDVYKLAQQLDLRKAESIDDIDIARIDPRSAVWMVEGGANRTSVVRRQLALEAVQAVYGEQAVKQTIYQFGSDRTIPKQKNDQPNAEYAIAEEIAGDHLPEDDSLTEFDLNMASALQSGYQRTPLEGIAPFSGIAERVEVLHKLDQPRLVLIQPKKAEGGLTDGINAACRMAGKDQLQPVIATNGQYRAKDELQAEQWARKIDLVNTSISQPVALGDEPGYKVEHNGKEIVTAERAPMAYVNEIVVLYRLQES